MSTRAASWLTWSMCTLCVGMAALGVWLLALLSRFPRDVVIGQWLDNVMVDVAFSPVLAVVPVMTFSTMGAIIRFPPTP